MDDQLQARADNLKRLAQAARFENLSAAEEEMLEKVSSGKLAICGPNDDDKDDRNNPKNADEWRDPRRVRAKLVAWLCTNGQARNLVHPRGIQVYGADIRGALELSFVNIPFQLAFRHCRLKDGLDLTRAEVSQLDLKSSLVHGIFANRIIVKNSVFLTRGFTTIGGVRLVGAQIGGDLVCEAGSFTDESATALDADRINVKGSVFLRRGLNAQGKETSFSARGGVNLNTAQIEGQLDCSGGVFSDPHQDGVEDSFALNAYRVVVRGSVALRDGFTAEGRVRLTGANVIGDFKCGNGNFQKATLDLTDASAGTLVDSEGTVWPEHNRLLLDGFTYGRISPQGRIDVDKRIDWLGRQPQSPFGPRPYLHLAEVLRDSGDSMGALRVLEKMEDLRRSDEARDPKLGPLGFLRKWAVRFLLKWTVGYGYYPQRAIWALLFLTLLGWILYYTGYFARTMVPTEKSAYAEVTARSPLPPHYPRFSALTYSLENSLPLVKLGQADKWQPDPGFWPLIWFLRVQILLGWLLATFFVAGVSGIVHKE